MTKSQTERSETLRTKRAAGQAERTAKFNEIVAVVGLPEDKVSELICDWAETRSDHINGVPIAEELQTLLTEHYQLAEDLSDPGLPETGVCNLCPF